MGQYHKPASLTKGETLNAHDLGSGIKLMEWSLNFGAVTPALALFIAPRGRWHGDRIAVVGDYAEKGDLREGLPFADDPAELYAADSDEASAFAKNLMAEAFGMGRGKKPGHYFEQPLFDPERLARMYTNMDDDPVLGPLYVVDMTKGEYLDPMAFGSGRNLPAIALRQAGVMTAATILLAISNGRGGGDLHCDGHPLEHLVGSWGGDRVVLGIKPEDGVDRSEELKTLFEEPRA